MSMRTDSSGRFTFPDCRPGPYRLEFYERPWLFPVHITHVPAPNEELTIEIPSADLSRSSLAGTTLPNLELSARPIGRGIRRTLDVVQTVSDAGGRFELSPLPAGQILLTATLSGALGRGQDLLVPLGRWRLPVSSHLEVGHLEIPPHGALDAQIIGHALESRDTSLVQARILDESGYALGKVATGPTGRIQERLPAGRYLLHLESYGFPGFACVSVPFEIVPAQITPLTVPTDEAYRIHVFVEETPSRGLSRLADLYLHSEDGSFLMRGPVRRSAEGFGRFFYLAEGRYRASVLTEDGRRGGHWIDVGSEHATTWPLSLD